MVHAPKDDGDPAGEPQGEKKAEPSINKDAALGCGLTLCLVAIAVIVTLMVVGGGRERQPMQAVAEPPPAAQVPWYQGGTLIGATVEEWLAADGWNRLATAADWAALMGATDLVKTMRALPVWREASAATILIETGTVTEEQLLAKALALMGCVDQAVADGWDDTLTRAAVACWRAVTPDTD